MRTPEQCLSTLLADAVAPYACAEDSFIESGLRAARNTRAVGRDAILADVAHVLDCAVEELDFMFIRPVRAANDIDPIILPDYRAALSWSRTNHGVAAAE